MKPDHLESEPPRTRLHLVGGSKEPLHRVLYANCIAFALHDDPGDALAAASEGDAVLLLARGYPESPTPMPGGLACGSGAAANFDDLLGQMIP